MSLIGIPLRLVAFIAASLLLSGCGTSEFADRNEITLCMSGMGAAGVALEVSDYNQRLSALGIPNRIKFSETYMGPLSMALSGNVPKIARTAADEVRQQKYCECAIQRMENMPEGSSTRDLDAAVKRSLEMAMTKGDQRSMFFATSPPVIELEKISIAIYNSCAPKTMRQRWN